MSVRALENLHCSNCGEITLHRAGVCVRTGCETPNNRSGNRPIPKTAKPYVFSVNPKHHVQARAEQAAARKRARRARHQHLFARGTA